MALPLMEPELLTNFFADIGEGPIWLAAEQIVVFLDIPAGAVHCYDPVRNSTKLLARGRKTGGLTIQEDGSLLLFQDGRISVLSLNGAIREVASGLCPQNERFNDVIADPEGRVFAGAMGGNGRLLRFDPDGRVTELLDGAGIPNGMGFSPDLKRFYFTDSIPRHIYCFDYDRRTGSISRRRIFAEIPADEGVPDGMTVDAEGYVWTAVWFGGRIKRYSPDGLLDREILLPAKQTSALAFGGNDLSDIYVTTASSTGADDIQPAGYDRSAFRGGGLYRIHPNGIRGTLPFRSRLSFPLTM
jgi:sugar lactone lactonase YvrE